VIPPTAFAASYCRHAPAPHCRESYSSSTKAGDFAGAQLLLLAWAIGPVYLEVVSPLENIFEDLKALPPDRLEMAASLIRRLKPISQVEREAALARTFGCLSPEEADEMERVTRTSR
jgi:hypothetical protein